MSLTFTLILFALKHFSLTLLYFARTSCINLFVFHKLYGIFKWIFKVLCEYSLSLRLRLNVAAHQSFNLLINHLSITQSTQYTSYLRCLFLFKELPLESTL